MTRKEYDSIGMAELPENAYYGIQSYRARQNFPLSGRKMLPEMIESLVRIKKAAARANGISGRLPREYENAIVTACDEILNGALRDQFIVDPIQGGAGTSANMNANEVIANRATELLGGTCGSYIVHPNDHVNMSQSTNDVFPTAGKLTVLRLLDGLETALEGLITALRAKAEAFEDVIKLGRTQLQDAVPIRLGREFAAYANGMARGLDRIRDARKTMTVLNIGATAIGTAINTTAAYMDNVVGLLSEETGEPLRRADDLVDATQNVDGFVDISAAIRNTALVMSKIANDLRLLSSGPRGGFEEIRLPARQHGSSIMPGKINPVIPEAVSQVAFRIAGNDTTVSMAAEAGQLELNAFEPIMFDSLFQSILLLTRVSGVFEKYCIEGITADRDMCRENLMNSTAMATVLCPLVGYEKATAIVKHALAD
ncbi:MAG: aspartate ammonia-lyase, partial [Clostridia bacterium]|nr:aspartate ammonia-lyase [Clostridia bacterium]